MCSGLLDYVHYPWAVCSSVEVELGINRAQSNVKLYSAWLTSSFDYVSV